jgi:hypothetical protein
MRLYQTWKNYAAQVLLEREVPVVTDWVRRRLVALHTDFFVDASERDGEAREPRLRALFEATLDVYTRALAEGYPESEAREITHIQATWDFGNQGWGELLEFPPEEREAYRERYGDFFERHDCRPEDPLGEFAPAGGLPDAPTTPERMAGEFPFAEPGLTDDVYVVAEETEVRLRCGDEPESEEGADDDRTITPDATADGSAASASAD